MTPREFGEAIKATNEELNFWFEAKTKQNYEVSRFVLFHLINISGKSLKRSMKAYTELVEFPWEKRQEKVGKSIDQMRMELMRIAQTYNKKKR